MDVDGISLSFDQGTLLLTALARDQLPEIRGSFVWSWDARVGAWQSALLLPDSQVTN